ncbi:hypothetical protein JAAARDRAFT_262514 [Jaapia argillacea MUCL 33604]|uniref:Uncharacterized protein n=1 Tax=Jaapia argillacea MUCL 33604 TaxID=933084 RepID=A0A067Q6R0_9AGAM|nr:hypothetical protein JAAARDRAFT_262514 [Jaapia argillacea MUCL 33604]
MDQNRQHIPHSDIEGWCSVALQISWMSCTFCKAPVTHSTTLLRFTLGCNMRVLPPIDSAVVGTQFFQLEPQLCSRILLDLKVGERESIIVGHSFIDFHTHILKIATCISNTGCASTAGLIRQFTRCSRIRCFCPAIPCPKAFHIG